jgi:hypothetical protein
VFLLPIIMNRLWFCRREGMNFLDDVVHFIMFKHIWLFCLGMNMIHLRYISNLCKSCCNDSTHVLHCLAWMKFSSNSLWAAQRRVLICLWGSSCGTPHEKYIYNTCLFMRYVPPKQAHPSQVLLCHLKMQPFEIIYLLAMNYLL